MRGLRADRSFTGRGSPMRLNRTPQDRSEPIGIVIADGGRGDALPKFSAFVWGPAPDDSDVVRDSVREFAATS